MSEWEWLRIIYLAMVLALLVGTVRTHRLGGRKMLVMLLAWLCIFMVAAGISAFISDWIAEPVLEPPPPEGNLNLT